MNKIICTWDPLSDCEKCVLHERLDCKWSGKRLLEFNIIILPAILCAVLGLIVIGMTNGMWWPLIAYIAFFPVVLGVFELRFLCSHCPFYAENGNILHCLANHGLVKLWSYHPEPMNRFEKKLMIILIILMGIVFPVAIFGFNIYFFFVNPEKFGHIMLTLNIGLALITILFEINAAFIGYNHLCNRCINFSCPFNSVPKIVVDTYLKKNITMRKAWEKTGYVLDD